MMECSTGIGVRMRSRTEGWLRGEVVECAAGALIVTVLEGTHKGEKIKLGPNYVESLGKRWVTPPGPMPAEFQPLGPELFTGSEPSAPPGVEETRFESGGQKYIRYKDKKNGRQWTVKVG